VRARRITLRSSWPDLFRCLSPTFKMWMPATSAGMTIQLALIPL
jgi:hypothetical protein